LWRGPCRPPDFPNPITANGAENLGRARAAHEEPNDMGILHFPYSRASRNICSGCRAMFGPLAPHHHLCPQCFKAARAVRALQTGARLWRECLEDRRR
jgi:hypothetical protein